MASSRTRQRKLERDRYERKLVRLAQKQRRRRQIQAGVGAFLSLALLGVGAAWLAGAFERELPPISVDRCTWLARDAAQDPSRVDVGTPPANPPTGGQQHVTMALDAGAAGSGEITLVQNISPDPCGSASLRYLAEQGFYEDTVCHQLFEGALRCGDPSGTGVGGPSYGFYAANFPVPGLDDLDNPAGDDPAGVDDPAGTEEPAEGDDPEPGDEGEADDEAADGDAAAEGDEAADAGAAPLYPAGTVAFADVAGENGSQFLIFYEDYDPESPMYPVIGQITSGLEFIEAIGAAGVAEGTTEPAEEVRLRRVTVTDEPQPSAG